jgi:hypothetical protein
VLGKGGKNVQIERAEKQESVHRISKMLKELVEFYTKDARAVSEISVTAINDLEQSVQQLISLVKNN